MNATPRRYLGAKAFRKGSWSCHFNPSKLLLSGSDAVRRVGAEIDGVKHQALMASLFFFFRMKSMPIIANHLARLFTSIGETGLVPPGFLDGMLLSLFKGRKKIVLPLDPTVFPHCVAPSR